MVFGCAKPSNMMSFNIRYDYPNGKENSWDNRKEGIINLINKYNPAILGIQEGSKNTVSTLNKSLAKYEFIGVATDGKTGGFYTAIFYDTTKYKVLNHSTFWLSETPDIPSKSWGAGLMRITTYGKFLRKKDKDTLHVFNAHFDHKGLLPKTKSAELIINKIRKLKLLDKKTIVMGDLNSLTNSKAITSLKTVLNDGIDISKSPLTGPKGTFNFFKKDYEPVHRIDYIFTKNLKILNYKHLENRRENGLWLSDHLPILIEVQH